MDNKKTFENQDWATGPLDRRGLRVAGPRLAMRDDPATKLKTPRNQAESERVNDAPRLAKLEFSTQGRQTYPSISPETF